MKTTKKTRFKIGDRVTVVKWRGPGELTILAKGKVTKVIIDPHEETSYRVEVPKWGDTELYWDDELIKTSALPPRRT